MIAPKPRGSIAPQAVQHEKVLLVEGETPSHFFEAIARYLGIDKEIEIRSFGGNSNLADQLELLASTEAFKALVPHPSCIDG
jgi:hypothetical protein